MHQREANAVVRALLDGKEDVRAFIASHPQPLKFNVAVDIDDEMYVADVGVSGPDVEAAIAALQAPITRALNDFGVHCDLDFIDAGTTSYLQGPAQVEPESEALSVVVYTVSYHDYDGRLLGLATIGRMLRSPALEALLYEPRFEKLGAFVCLRFYQFGSAMQRAIDRYSQTRFEQ